MSKSMSGRQKSTTATVCIVESLDFLQEDTHREGEIVFRTLRLSGKRAHYSYIRSRRELEAFAKEFGRSKHRYLHISCHGSSNAFWTTTDKISSADLAKILAPNVRDRRVFLSACLAAKSEFARELLLNSDCISVLAPVGEIYFDDAAIFWTTFYHLMFKENPNSMRHSRIEKTVEQCARLIGEKFRFFYIDDKEVQSMTLG